MSFVGREFTLVMKALTGVLRVAPDSKRKQLVDLFILLNRNNPWSTNVKELSLGPMHSFLNEHFTVAYSLSISTLCVCVCVLGGGS